MNVGPFKEWWACNQDSDELYLDYTNYRTGCSHMGIKPKSYKDWGKEHYKTLKML
jgi:hypothetical protein